MTPKQIKIALRERGLSQRAVAQQVGVSEMFMSRVVRKKDVGRRVMEAIAKAIDKDVREVFPEYFDLPSSDAQQAA